MIDIDLDHPVIQLIMAGIQAEFQGRNDAAHDYYRQAWAAAGDDYTACIAAHYLARHQEDPRDKLHWNQVALDKAQAVADERVTPFYPSLYLNLGQSHALLGHHDQAQNYYALAAEWGVVHQEE